MTQQNEMNSRENLNRADPVMPSAPFHTERINTTAESLYPEEVYSIERTGAYRIERDGANSAMSGAIVEPTSIRLSAEPGETVTQNFVVNQVPSHGALVATISGGSSNVRLQKFFAYKYEQYWYTDDEINELPPNMREKARREGYKEIIKVAQVEAGTALQVWSELHVEGVVEFSAPASAASASESATLVIEGWEGKRVEIPLTLIIGQIQVEFLVSPIVGHLSQDVSLPVRISLPAGTPAAEVVLNSFEAWVSIPPQNVSIPAGGSVTTTLKLHVEGGAPLGPLSTNLWIKGFSDIPIVVPFVVEIKEFSQQIFASEQIQAKAAIQSVGPAGPRIPISDTEDAGNGGFVQKYSTGNIYWHPDTGAKWVYGAILQKYVALGGPSSFLGYPVTDEGPTPNLAGRLNDFKNGSIYFSNKTGAQEVHGRIRDHWRTLGAETSYLGFPTFDQKGDFSRFETGTIQLQSNEFVFDVSDAREYKTGVINVDGAAANGWAELMVSSSGGYKFKGSMRSTGLLSYDVLMVVSIDLRPFGGPVLAFTEKGSVHGTLVLGNREHTWDTPDMDSRIKDNWPSIRKAGINGTLTVEFGLGDIVALVGTVIGAPVIAIAMILGGAWLGNKKACGYLGHEYYDTNTNSWSQEKGVVFVDKDQPCPPGTVE